MKKVFCVLAFMLLALSMLSAAFSVVIPERRREDYSILSFDGDVLPLDNSVFYKHWNGILAENLDTGIYKITEGSDSCIVVMSGASAEDLFFSLRFEEADTIIFQGGFNGEPEVLAEAGIKNVVFTRRLSELEERLFQNEGINIIYTHPGSLVDIPLEYKKPELIYCPRCGYAFSLD